MKTSQNTLGVEAPYGQRTRSDCRLMKLPTVWPMIAEQPFIEKDCSKSIATYLILACGFWIRSGRRRRRCSFFVLVGGGKFATPKPPMLAVVTTLRDK